MDNFVIPDYKRGINSSGSENLFLLCGGVDNHPRAQRRLIYPFPDIHQGARSSAGFVGCRLNAVAPRRLHREMDVKTVPPLATTIGTPVCPRTVRREAVM